MSLTFDTAIYVWGGASAVTGIAWIVNLVAFSRMLPVLRSEHPSAFQMLGHPRLFASSALRSRFLMYRFLLFGEYKELENRRLNIIAGTCRVMYFIMIPAMGLMVVLLFLRWG